MISHEAMFAAFESMIVNLRHNRQHEHAAVLEQAKGDLERLQSVEAELAGALNVNASLNREILSGMHVFRFVQYENALQAIATADPSVFPPRHDPAEWVLAFQQFASAALDGKAPYQVIRVPMSESLAENLAPFEITPTDEQVVLPKWAVEYFLTRGWTPMIQAPAVYLHIKQAYLQANGREEPRGWCRPLATEPDIPPVTFEYFEDP